jgi:DNA invertase Pin-like site-specific DNA recombinase
MKMSKHYSNEKNMVQRVAIYAMVNIGQQTIEDSTLEFQIDSMKEYAEKHGYEVVRIFKDDSIIGRTDDRPELKEMKTMLGGSHNPFDAVLVWNSRCIARNGEDSIECKLHFRRKFKIDLISINKSSEDQLLDSLLEDLLETMSGYYRKNLSEDIRRGIKASKERKLAGIVNQSKEHDVAN